MKILLTIWTSTQFVWTLQYLRPKSLRIFSGLNDLVPPTSWTFIPMPSCFADIILLSGFFSWLWFGFSSLFLMDSHFRLLFILNSFWCCAVDFLDTCLKYHSKFMAVYLFFIRLTSFSVLLSVIVAFFLFCLFTIRKSWCESCLRCLFESMPSFANTFLVLFSITSVTGVCSMPVKMTLFVTYYGAFTAHLRLMFSWR